MEFDVIIGNPPYHQRNNILLTTASPVYHLFVEQAFAMRPRYAVFITPSRWMTGGNGPKAFRQRMMADRRIRRVVDFPDTFEVFQDVQIEGGVSYFLWDREHDGPCLFQTMRRGIPDGAPTERFLDDYDIVVRDNRALAILAKVVAQRLMPLSVFMLAGRPFGFRTNSRGVDSPDGLRDPVKLYRRSGVSWVDRNDILVNREAVDRWKVLIPRIHGEGGRDKRHVIGRPIMAEPGSACTDTYLIVGHFATQEQANNMAAYLRTKCVRFLVSLRKATQDCSRGVFGFVPDLGADKAYTDPELYEMYSLTQDEIAYIEEEIWPM